MHNGAPPGSDSDSNREHLDEHRGGVRRGRLVTIVGLVVLLALGISLALAASHSTSGGYHGPIGSNPKGPGFTSGSGDTGTGNTGSAGISNTGSGNSGTGNTGSGNSGTGNS